MEHEKNSVKVCLIGIRQPVDDHRMYHKEALSLFNRGYRVVLIGNEGKNQPKLESYILKGNTIRRLLLGIIWAIKANADIYHVHDLEALLVGILIKSVKPTSKLIWDVREYYEHETIESNSLGMLFINFMMKFILPLSIKLSLIDGFIVVSPDLAERYSPYGKTLPIYNYPRVLLTGKEKKYHKKRNKDIRLVYIGGISDYRFEFIHEIAKYAHSRGLSLKFHLFGPLRLRRFRIDLPNLKYHGVLPHPEVVKTLPTFNIGLLLINPKQKNAVNGVAIKLFEYAVAGLPILVNRELWRNYQYVKENKWGEGVEFGNVEGAIEKIYKLIENWPYYHKNCIKNVKKYLWKYEEKKLLLFYKILCKLT